MRYFSAFMSLVTTAGLVLVSATAHASPGDTECGVDTLGSLALVECANPNDSPGPSAPPPVTLFLVQDSAGVSAQLDDGTVIDIDANPDGTVDYAIDGATADVDEVAAELDAQLSDAEQAAMSEVLNATSVSDGTDELVDLLSE